MNEDDNNLQPWIEPELEARVVASVLGEASAFETADLERELAEKPELAIFKRRIEAVHGLVASASRPERPALRLSPDRRRKLLETIGGAASASNSKVNVLERPRFQWLTGRLLVQVAACLVVCLVIATLFFPAQQASLATARRVAESQKQAWEPAPLPADALKNPTVGRITFFTDSEAPDELRHAKESLARLGSENRLTAGSSDNLIKNGTAALTIGGNGSGSGGIAGAGGTLMLGGANTYTGGTSVNGGTLAVTAPSQTQIESKLVEIDQNNLEELGLAGRLGKSQDGAGNGASIGNFSKRDASAPALGDLPVTGRLYRGDNASENESSGAAISGGNRVASASANGNYYGKFEAGEGGADGTPTDADRLQAMSAGSSNMTVAAGPAPSGDGALRREAGALEKSAPPTGGKSFGGPPPFTDMSAMQSEIDGSYQAAARGDVTKTGALRSEYGNGAPAAPEPPARQWAQAELSTGWDSLSATRKAPASPAAPQSQVPASASVPAASSGIAAAEPAEATDAKEAESLADVQQSEEAADSVVAVDERAERSKGVDLMSAPTVTTKSGQHATVSVIREFRYPDEFKPPEIPQADNSGYAPAALPSGAGVQGLVAGTDAQRAGGTAISSNSPDGLVFGSAIQPEEASPQSETASAASAAAPAASTSQIASAGKQKKFDGFINYGSPIYTGGGKDVSAQPNAVNQPVFSTRRTELTAQVDADWQLPVTKFDVGNAQVEGQPDANNHDTSSIYRKFDEIRIPKLDFREATVREALDYIKARAAALDTKEPDPNKRGINIVLKLDPENKASADARVTLQLTDVSLGQAIQYLASAASLKVKVRSDSVSVVPLSDATDVLITKEYKVSPEFVSDFNGKFNAKQFLEASGTTFPPGAAANYLPASGKLIVRNTQDNLDLVDQLVEVDVARQNELEKKTELAAAQSEINSGDQPFSTFSLHVADVSFQLAKDAFARGEMPDPDQIRTEEFYNAFDYGDPAPAAGEEVACRIEQSAHPFLQQRDLVRIAMKVGAVGRNASQPLRLTILLDTSGSMEREDRAASVRKALESLASLLGPDDRVTLIGFARQPRLLAENVPGDQAGKLVDIARRTPSEGGTNLEAALGLATELAGNQYLAAAQNRVVLLTDGAANLGNADPAQLAKGVEKLRGKGVAFDACGVGADGLNDSILEALTRKGDGRYYFLNKPEDADAGFAKQLAGAFRPAAENVKVQVRFNPRRVGKYRLLGFEQNRLKKEDFRNDKVDAAELSAEEAAVAVYQVEPLPDGEGELGEVFVRFRDPASGEMVERSWTMPYDAQAPSFDKASPSMQLAGTAAMIAEKLRGGPAADAMDLKSLAPVINELRNDYPNQERVRDLIRMFGHLAQ